MTIDEAIKEYMGMSEAAERFVDKYSSRDTFVGSVIKDMRQRISKDRQLAEWLTELKEAKRLLKLALEQTNPKCKYCIHDLEEEQPNYNPCCTGETANCKWIYADEAEKLLNKI